MSIFRRCRWRFSLFLVLALCLLAAVSQGARGVAEAQEPPSEPDVKSLSDSVGCWVSGPYRHNKDIKHSWGLKSEFVVLFGDHAGLFESGKVWSTEKDVAVEFSRDDDRDGDNEDDYAKSILDLYGVVKRRPAYFMDFPSYIDHAFGINTESGSVDSSDPLNDVRYAYIKAAVDGAGEETRPDLFVPWMDGEEYFKRRSVAWKVESRVADHKGTGWVVDSLPQGGFADDPVALLEDSVAADVNRDRSKTKAVYDGSRFTVVEGQVAANEINGVYDGHCADGVCTMAWNLNSEPTQVEMRGFERHQSDDETFQNQFENTLRYVNTVDEGGDTGTLAIPTAPGNIGDITFPSRRLGSHGFRDWRQQDTGDDSIQVNIVLDDEFRRDFLYESVSPSGAGKHDYHLPVFGEDVWTYEGFGNASALDAATFWKERPSGRRNEAVNILSERSDFGGEGAVFDRSTHVGYRQPVLDRFYLDDGDEGVLRVENSHPDTEHIRWPVHIEDMNWYLYELPGHITENPSPLLFYVREVGFRRVARSGYALIGLDPDKTVVEDAANGFPSCQNQTPGVYTVESIVCDFGEGWDKPAGGLTAAAGRALSSSAVSASGWGAYQNRQLLDISADPWIRQESAGLIGDEDPVRTGYFPFDVQGNTPRLSWEMLSRFGVVSASDIDGRTGSRKLSRFSFEINESSVTGDEVSDLEGDVLYQRRLGVPKSDAGMRAAVGGMPAKRLDPNRAHLLVFTFYEGVHNVRGWSQDGARYILKVDGKESGEFSLPRRRLRRVVCRMVILPLGFDPAMEKNANLFEEVWSKVKGAIGHAVREFAGWITRFMGSVVKAPFWAAKKASEVGCAGLEKVDKVTALQFSAKEPPETEHAGSGILVANESVQNKRRGLDACFRMAEPVEVDCDPGADVVYRGRCTDLPQPRVYIERGEFLNLEGRDIGVGYDRYETVRIDATPLPAEFDRGVIGSYRGAVVDDGGGSYRTWDQAPGGTWRMRTIKVNDTRFYPVPPGVDQSDQYVADDNAGLTRLSVRWETDSSVVSDLPLYRSTGYVVIVYPDEKSSPFLEGQGIKFVLPRWVKAQPFYNVPANVDAPSGGSEARLRGDRFPRWCAGYTWYWRGCHFVRRFRGPDVPVVA